MNLALLTAADLRRITSLVEHKEDLLRTVSLIDAELTAFSQGGPVPQLTLDVKPDRPEPSLAPVNGHIARRRLPVAITSARVSGDAQPPEPRRSSRRRPTRGSIGALITATLARAGSGGLTIEQLQQQTNLSRKQVVNFLGRGLPGFHKIGRAHYAYSR
jgi:hypothetical protein